MTAVTAEIRVNPAWLDLREHADATARAPELAELLQCALPFGSPLVIHDLACGSGAMGRWLAPRLAGPQRWILHDRDPDLLALAEVDVPGPAADGADVVVETRRSDITRLGPDDLAGASLVTASALLDLLTRDELATIVRSCTETGCAVLFTLSVTGQVRLGPGHRLDTRVAAAFDAHQRRATARGHLLGPDAVDAAIDEFRRLGAEVVVRPSPWRLGAADTGLVVEWLNGWVGAAFEQDEELEADADPYRRRRLRAAHAGLLSVTVRHADLLVLP